MYTMAIWDKLSSRGRVEDRRGMGPAIGGGLGIAGVVLITILKLLAGGSPADVLPDFGNALVQSNPSSQAADFEGADSYEVFASTVLGSTNDMWQHLFADTGRTYREPTLVLFRSATQSACGGAVSQVGPHYCPLDETIYLDETFFEELEQRLGAQGGDVAEAYVMAHEAGHHAQEMLGVGPQVRELQSAEPDRENELSVKLELQADCFAGLWAYSIRDKGVFAPGEINEAIDAARAVGDDRIQQETTGRVNPELWTHGSSAERVAWFNKGYETGELAQCNTFQ